MNVFSSVVEKIGRANLARAFDVTPQAIRKWENGRVPAERCRQIEAVASENGVGDVTRYELRPDVFGEKPEIANA